MLQTPGSVSSPQPDNLTHAETRAAIETVAGMARYRLATAVDHALKRAAKKADSRRFTGAPVSGFGALS